MKKIRILYVVYVFSMFSMYAQNKDIDLLKDISNSVPKNLYVIDYAIGNFISEKDVSVIVFCDDVKNKNISKTVQKTFLYEINK